MIISYFGIQSIAFAEGRQDAINRVLERAGTTNTKSIKRYACQTEENRMKSDISGLVSLAQAMVEKTNNYVSMTDQYYNQKFTPKGFQIDDFGHFLDVTSQDKAANTKSIEAIKNYAKNITCIRDDAKASLNGFKIEMKNIINNLNESKKITRQVLIEMKQREGGITPEFTVATSSALPSVKASGSSSPIASPNR